MRLDVSFRLLVLLALSTTQFGCGLFKKSGKSGPGGPPGFSLSGEESKNFEAWKVAPLKSCQIDHAFEGKAPSSEQRSVDLRAFFEKSQNSLVLRNGSSFVLFGSPSGLLGNGVSSLTRSSEINGNSEEFGAKMTRNGSHCVVEINGEKVFETYLFSSMPVELHSKGKISGAKTYETYISQTDQGVMGHGLIDALIRTRIRSEELAEQLKDFFPDWTDADLKRFFIREVSSSGFFRHVAEVNGFEQLPINASFPAMPSSVLGWQVITAATGDLGYKLTIPVTRLNYGPLNNSGDQGLWQLKVNISWKSSELNKAAYAINELQWIDQIGEDSKKVVDCFHSRLNTFSGGRVYGSGVFSPSFEGVTDPCEAFTSDIIASLYSDNVLRNRMASLFAGRERLDGSGYLGWEQALKRFALYSFSQGDDFPAAFDPQGKSTVISTMGAYMAMVGNAAGRHDNLKSTKSEYVSSLALPWASSGKIVEQNLVDRLIAAISNISDTFGNSLSGWLQDLARDPSSQSAQIDFATGVTAETKADIKAYMDKADASGLRFTVSDIKLKRVIQDRIDVTANLAGWNATLDALAGFKARDKAKANDSSKAFYENEFKSMAQKVILEDWSDSDFSQVDRIVQLAKKKPFCKEKVDSLSLMECIGSEAFSRKRLGFFNPSFGGRYNDLASEFSSHFEKLQASEFVFIRQNLVDGFYSPIWKSCDNAAFSKNRKDLSDLVSKAQTAQFPALFEIRNQIDDLLEACN